MYQYSVIARGDPVRPYRCGTAAAANRCTSPPDRAPRRTCLRHHLSANGTTSASCRRKNVRAVSSASCYPVTCASVGFDCDHDRPPVPATSSDRPSASWPSRSIDWAHPASNRSTLPFRRQLCCRSSPEPRRHRRTACGIASGSPSFLNKKIPDWLLLL